MASKKSDKMKVGPRPEPEPGCFDVELLGTPKGLDFVVRFSHEKVGKYLVRAGQIMLYDAGALYFAHVGNSQFRVSQKHFKTLTTIVNLIQEEA